MPGGATLPVSTLKDCLFPVVSVAVAFGTASTIAGGAGADGPARFFVASHGFQRFPPPCHEIPGRTTFLVIAQQGLQLTDGTFQKGAAVHRFFGLQYFLDSYLTWPITREHAEEYYSFRKMILGSDPGPDIRAKFDRLAERGHVSLGIKAVPEGSVVPVQNVLMTITNTEPDAYWQVGFFESLLLKVWNTTTVASYSQKLYQLVLEYAHRTSEMVSIRSA